MVPKKIGKNKISVRPNITKEIKLAEIVVELDMQSRAELDDEITKEYAEDINLGADFPPVDVFNDGTYYFLTDGFHRYYAHQIAGKKSIKANIHKGSRRDAILFSVGVNATHGLRRTNKDKRNVVFKLLRDDEWVEMSDGQIANYCAVSQPFVGKLREELTQNGYEFPSKRKCADGCDRETSKIGKNKEPANGKKTSEDLVTDDSFSEKSTDGDKSSAPENREPKVRISELITDIISQLTELQKLKPDDENRSESEIAKIATILNNLNSSWVDFTLRFKDLISN